MKKTTVLAAAAIGAAAIGISFAPAAAADTSNCQSVGGTTLCGHGNVGGGGQSTGTVSSPVPAPPAGGCLNQYGVYQNCGTGGGGGG
jgi:hypothetical protein